MTSTTHHETQIVSDPDVPLVRIVREFDAPPEKVFRAHIDPDLFTQWTGPNGMEMRIDHFDCRTGGVVPLRDEPRRRGLRLQRLLPRGAARTS